MSTVEPFGTWQYAQQVWFPGGTRELSNKDGWTRMMYGFSGCLPALTSSSDVAIASNVPPRCTVAARLHCMSFHGTADERAQSTLNTAGPYRYFRSPRWYLPGNAAPAICSNCRGVTSHITIRDDGRSFSELIGAEVKIRPPSLTRQAANALAICCEPPFGKGHP